ncbi:MAG: 2Fe-2S iron-sulfur cluster binding domain-containing protein [Methylotenera sp.]|nr:2Fe-2S iron-sulfur cluster binding domain-containing protein [Oligoflexia bacterium]
MSIRFKGHGGQVFDTGFCETNLNLLAHAQALELDLGSECGGHGICGKDRVQLDLTRCGNFSPLTEDEKRHLSEGEILQGWRLACQCFPEDPAENSLVELSILLR